MKRPFVFWLCLVLVTLIISGLGRICAATITWTNTSGGSSTLMASSWAQIWSSLDPAERRERNIESCRVNVALPLASWTPITTNTLNGSGQSSFTNRMNSGKLREFFILKL
jgi:hypothetical protein